MTSGPERIVDAHVHLWDPGNVEWYPYLSGRQDIGMGNTSKMERPFTASIHREEAGRFHIDKLINVAAATGRNSIDETLALDARAAAEGQPAAIIGGLPPTERTSEAIDLLERQMQAERFRGVRPMGQVRSVVPDAEVLRALSERGLIFELMAHPDELAEAARSLSEIEDLTIVVEHMGWPRSGDTAEFDLWARGLEALAALGPRVACKLSGLAMPLGTMDPEVLAPWISVALELFGEDRCCFASNFPVDGLHGSLEELFDAYAQVVAPLGDEVMTKLFATNAERIYRC
jgi:predicted TIM-barrel fold metal-dependent hydrolase